MSDAQDQRPTGDAVTNGFAANCDTRANRIAVRFETESLTFGELAERSAALAHALGAVGLSTGERLAVMLPNSIEFIECLAASARLEVACLTLNWHLRADELAWVLEDSGATALVAHTELAPVVDAALAGRGLPVIWVGGDYEDRLAGAQGPPLPFPWPTAWPVIYTSGTSGRPKGVVHGAAPTPALMSMAYDALAEMWTYRSDDVHLVAGPLYHAGPLGYANLTLYVGGTVVIMDSWDPLEFLRAVQSLRVSTTFLTPAHLIRILEVPDDVRSRHDLSSLRHVIHAGAPCPIHVKQRIIEALPHAAIWEFYGMSEGGATRVSSEEWLARPGTVGRPWPGVEIRIIDPHTGEQLGAGEDGLVYVRPAMGRFHYHNNDAQTAAAWMDDVFTVGDIGHLDSDGYLFLTDRQSDLIIRNAVNISPREIEAVLHRHPAVVDCAVFGVPHDRDGEQVAAVVETRFAVTVDVLQAWCREQLDPFMCPSRIEVLDELPRDPNGKILKRLLREQAWAATGRAI